MSLSSTSNSLKSSGTFNSNSSISSTPSADRYAALKDLDEQLREIKEKDNFNTPSSSSTSLSGSSSSANPFKLPLQQQQQQQQQLAHNPFQTSAVPSGVGTQNGWMTEPQPFGNLNNSISDVQAHIYSSLAGYNNGTATGNASYINGFNGIQNHMQPKNAMGFNGNSTTQNGFAQKNPFAVCK
jgi:hypothetical protein